MAIAKLTSSGKAVQFIDDEGNIFGTSVAYMKQLLYGFKEKNMILLARMPYKASPDRYMKSPVYDPSGKGVTNVEGPLSTTNDSLSVKTRQDNINSEQYNKIINDF